MCVRGETLLHFPVPLDLDNVGLRKHTVYVRAPIGRHNAIGQVSLEVKLSTDRANNLHLCFVKQNHTHPYEACIIAWNDRKQDVVSWATYQDVVHQSSLIQSFFQHFWGEKKREKKKSWTDETSAREGCPGV